MGEANGEVSSEEVRYRARVKREDKHDEWKRTLNYDEQVKFTKGNKIDGRIIRTKGTVGSLIDPTKGFGPEGEDPDPLLEDKPVDKAGKVKYWLVMYGLTKEEGKRVHQVFNSGLQTLC